MRVVAALLALAVLLGLAPAPPLLDSQIVLQRYEIEMTDLPSPKAMIFSYTVSQAGPADIEQRHVLYRSGLDVRDETIAVDGAPLRSKVVRIGRREDRYDILRLAPRSATYTLLFLNAVRDGNHLDYQYEATPLAASSGFVVERLTIDGSTYLPRTIAFRTVSAVASGSGKLEFAKVGGYCVPISATVDATVKGKPAREHIAWSAYRFPASLPASTFVAPKPLPQATLPPI
jgi:hypothetical protein